LRAVGESKECSAEGLKQKGISVTCVGSTAIQGTVLAKDIEEFVASVSYTPLLDDWKDITSNAGVRGDGIIPESLAFMDGCNRVEIELCSITGNKVRHAHVLPTPYNLWDPAAASISLPGEFCWYGSTGVVEKWIEFV